jgi:hypothetical protein
MAYERVEPQAEEESSTWARRFLRCIPSQACFDAFKFEPLKFTTKLLTSLTQRTLQVG